MDESAEKDGRQVELESVVCSQVVFMDVLGSYPVNADVICCYKLTEGLTPSTKDWIGIYKVGWDTAKKYYCYQWVKASTDNEGLDILQHQIVFQGYYLPKDDGEFYQFCYVDSNGKVRGVSTSFCFQNQAELSLDCSLLVISTQDQLEETEREKEALLTEIEQLKERNIIFKNELDERLREICSLKVYIDQLKSSGLSKSLQLKEQPESQPQYIHERSFLSDSVTEITPEQEPMTHFHEKYQKAVKKIHMLKQDIAQLEQQAKEKDTELSGLKAKVKKAEQDCNRLHDQFQLQQVDMQSTAKEKERLLAENEEKKSEIERLLEENKALHKSLSNQEPPDEDKNDKKMQILILTNELTEVRGTLRKEILNRNEAIKRADKAELELNLLITQREKRTVTQNRQLETQLTEAHRKISEQESMAAVAQVEKAKLTEENEKLKNDIERLQVIICELSSGVNMSSTQQQQNHVSPVPTSPVTAQQQPPSDSYCYENIGGPFVGNPSNSGNKVKVCRHCQESFPDITEDELAIHEQAHKVCPFCTLICDNCGQQAFEDHVYSHEE